MALVEIPDAIDSRLVAVVPDYMRAARNRTKRVRWALDEFFRLSGNSEAPELKAEDGAKRATA